MPPMMFDSMVGQASFQTAGSSGPSMMERSNFRGGGAGAGGRTSGSADAEGLSGAEASVIPAKVGLAIRHCQGKDVVLPAASMTFCSDAADSSDQEQAEPASGSQHPLVKIKHFVFFVVNNKRETFSSGMGANRRRCFPTCS